MNRNSVANAFLVAVILAVGSPTDGAVVVHEITGSFGDTEHSCTQIAHVLGGFDCSFGRNWPGVAVEADGITPAWGGPVFGGAHYQLGSSGDALGHIPTTGVYLGGTSFSPATSDGKYVAPITGTVTIDDNGTPSNPFDDRLSAEFSIGALSRNVATGATARAIQRWTSMDHVMPATTVSSATPNGSGGYDYIIGSRGFPERLCSRASEADCFPTASASNSVTGDYDSDELLVSFWMPIARNSISVERSGQLADPTWATTFPRPPATPPTGNVGAQTIATFTGYECYNSVLNECLTSPLIWGGGETPGFDNLVMRLSTNDAGDITEVQAYWTQEYFISAFGGIVGYDNAVQYGFLTLAGRSSSTFPVVSTSNGISDLFSATFDGALSACTPSDPDWCAFFNGKPGPGRAISITPDPTGTTAGVPNGIFPAPEAGSYLELATNSARTQVTLTGGTITFPPVTMTIQGGTPNATDVTITGGGLVFDSAPQFAALDADGRAEFLVNLAPATAVDFSNFSVVANSCSGPLCALIPILTLDMVRYRLAVDFDPTYSTFTAEFIGETSGNSLLYITMNSAEPDSIPEPFQVQDQFGVLLSTTVTSAPVTIQGLTTSAGIAVSGDSSSSYSVNGGAFTAAPGVIGNGNTVRVRHTSSAAPDTAVDTVLTIGGVSDTFTSITQRYAVDDTATTSSDQPVQINVLQNDNGLAPIVFVGLWIAPGHGTAQVSGAPGAPAGISITYTPSPGYVGPDSFEYWLESGLVVDYGLVSVSVTNPDTDGDGIPNELDNCTLVANASQCDSDGDGYGNRCDGDLTGNGFTNAQDAVVVRARLGAPSTAPTFDAADLNCNGFINAQDTALFRQLLGKPPGPSGQVP